MCYKDIFLITPHCYDSKDWNCWFQTCVDNPLIIIPVNGKLYDIGIDIFSFEAAHLVTNLMAEIRFWSWNKKSLQIKKLLKFYNYSTITNVIGAYIA